MTKSGDAGQNLVGGLRPHEGLGLRVGVSNVGPDGRLEGVNTGVHAAAQLALRQ